MPADLHEQLEVTRPLYKSKLTGAKFSILRETSCRKLRSPNVRLTSVLRRQVLHPWYSGSHPFLNFELLHLFLLTQSWTIFTMHFALTVCQASPDNRTVVVNQSALRHNSNENEFTHMRNRVAIEFHGFLEWGCPPSRARKMVCLFKLYKAVVEVCSWSYDEPFWSSSPILSIELTGNLGSPTLEGIVFKDSHTWEIRVGGRSKYVWVEELMITANAHT